MAVNGYPLDTNHQPMACVNCLMNQKGERLEIMQLHDDNAPQGNKAFIYATNALWRFICFLRDEDTSCTEHRLSVLAQLTEIQSLYQNALHFNFPKTSTLERWCHKHRVETALPDVFDFLPSAELVKLHDTLIATLDEDAVAVMLAPGALHLAAATGCPVSQQLDAMQNMPYVRGQENISL